MLIWPEDAEVNVQLVDENSRALAISNVLLNIIFYTSGVIRYSFSAGKTDRSGSCLIRFSDITEEWLENRQLFLMDYNTPLQDCDEEIGILSPSAEDLFNRIIASKKWFPEAIEETSREVDSSNNYQLHCREQKFRIGPNVLDLNIIYVCKLIC